MKNLSINKKLIAAFVACTVSYAGISNAHEAGATLDAEGVNRSFTGMASISCHDDGSGTPDHLSVSIRDNSPPVAGLMVNVVVQYRTKVNSITDTVSGDADFSPFISLQGGIGPYKVIVNKTNIGARDFDLQYHCNTFDEIHTGTQIGIDQFGNPLINPQ